MSQSDFRIFKDRRSGDWILCNDHKKRKLIDQGYSRRKAKELSHGHIKQKKMAEQIKKNILGNVRTKSRDIWILGCYTRVADKTYKHYNWVCGLHETKIDKLT